MSKFHFKREKVNFVYDVMSHTFSSADIIYVFHYNHPTNLDFSILRGLRNQSMFLSESSFRDISLRVVQTGFARVCFSDMIGMLLKNVLCGPSLVVCVQFESGVFHHDNLQFLKLLGNNFLGCSQVVSFSSGSVFIPISSCFHGKYQPLYLLDDFLNLVSSSLNSFSFAHVLHLGKVVEKNRVKGYLARSVFL
uniref:Uncharacterized protein n=1 Tax=Goniomonas avonlea TaxID=1255295 RepID=A0A348G6L0_9CRYP|nr:hypothetical protein [Goniomonas avonlea]